MLLWVDNDLNMIACLLIVGIIVRFEEEQGVR